MKTLLRKIVFLLAAALLVLNFAYAQTQNALNFDGSNDVVTIDGGFPINSNSVTFEAWIKPSGNQINYKGFVLTRQAASNEVAGIISTENSNKFTYMWKGLGFDWQGGPGIIPNEWQHVALVITPNGITMYHNGIPYVASTAATVPTDLATTAYLGNDPGSTLRFFSGDLDEVRIWNTSRTCEEIRTFAEVDLDPNSTGLVAYYKFNQGTAGGDNTAITTLVDETGNHNGRLTSGTGTQLFTLTGTSGNFIDGKVMTNGSTIPTAAQLEVRGNNEIMSSNAAASLSNQSDFGRIFFGTAKTNDFKIRNTGGLPFRITNITIAAPDNLFRFQGGTLPTFPIQVDAGAEYNLAIEMPFIGINQKTGTATIQVDLGCGVTETFVINLKGEYYYDAALNLGGAVPTFPALNINSSAITIEASINITSTTSSIFNEANTGIVLNNAASALASGIIMTGRNRIGYVWKGMYRTWTGGPTLSTGMFHHVALVVESDKATLWVNGIPYVNEAPHDLSNSFNETSTIAFWPAYGRYYAGRIDEIRIWSLARDCEDLKGYARANLRGNESGLVAYYNMNEGNQNTRVEILSFLDITGNGFHGTLPANFNLSSPNIYLSGLDLNDNFDPAPVANAILKSGSNTIAPGSTDINTTIGTDFGTISSGQTVMRGFQLENNGSSNLEILSVEYIPNGSSVPVSGVFTSSFTATPVAPGQQAVISITFNPLIDGLNAGKIRITSNICNAPQYEFAVSGRANVQNAVNLSGTSQFISTPIMAEVFEEITIEAWIRPTANIPQYSGLVVSRVSDPPFGIIFSQTNRLGYIWNNQHFDFVGGPSVVLNEWNHVALTITPNSATLVANGVSVTRSIAHEPLDMTNRFFKIGLDDCCSGRNFLGDIDEVRIWNKSLTPLELSNNANAELEGSESGLRLYFKFNEGKRALDNTSIGGPINHACNDLGDGVFHNMIKNGPASNYVAGAPVTRTNPSAGSLSVTTKNITLPLGANGSIILSPEQVLEGSIDAGCSNITLSLDITAFDCDDLGENTVTLTVSDDAGNTSSATATVTIVDNLAPTVSVRNITRVLPEDGTGITITPADVDNGSTDLCSAVVLELSKASFDCDDLGENTISLIVRDAGGNQSSADVVVTIVSETAPVPAIANLPEVQGECQVTLVPPSAVSLCGENITATLKSREPEQIAINVREQKSTTPVQEEVLSLDFNAGIFLVEWLYQDESGNQTIQTQRVVVTDDEAPQAIAKNITVYLGINGTATINASDVNDGSTDNCADPILSLSKASFSCEDLGENEITLTARDLAGNSATASAIITIIDTVSITAIAKNISISLSSTGTANITADMIDDGSFGGCSQISLSINKTSFDCEDLGENQITLSISDESGNTQTATAIVTVIDDLAPVPQIATLSTLSGSCEISPIAPKAIDNCSGSITATTETVFPITSSMTITWVYDDGNGNVFTQEQEVVIEDDQAPVFESFAVAESYVVNSLGCGFDKEDLPQPVALDNCSELSISNDAPAVLPLGQTTVVWTAEDASGNTATISRVINVVSASFLELAESITVCQGQVYFIEATGAESYVWSNGMDNGTNMMFEANTTLSVTGTNAFGCTETREISIEVLPAPMPGLTYDEETNTLEIDGSYASYVWKLNGVPITDASSNVYQPSVSGIYQVLVTTNDGCEGSTNEVEVTIAVLSTSETFGFEVYPNPARDRLNIRLQNGNDAHLYIRDAGGRILHAQQVDQNHAEINTQDFAPGMYLISIHYEGQVLNKRLIIEK